MDRNSKIIRNLNLPLNEKEAKTLLALMREGRLTNSELKKLLNFKSENSAKYYRRKLEKAKIIEGYSAVVNWEKLGLGTKFMIIAESDKETLRRIERDHVFSAWEYLKKVGDIVVTPTLFGPVLLKEVMTSYGKVGVILGYACSENAAKYYCEVYLKERYRNIKTKLYILKDTTIKDFFIQRDFLMRYIELSPPTDEDKIRLDRFRKEFLERFSHKRSE